LVRLHGQYKITTVYVTHDQVEAMTMADRIVVMNAGNIEQIGRPLDLYDDPQSIFVAGFIGSPSMNLLDGRFDEADGRAVFRTDADVILPLPNGVSEPKGTKAVYGIRPEYLAMSPKEPGILAKVVVVEPLGPETQVTALVGDQTVVAMTHERISLEPDEMIWLVPQVERVCLFDEPGRRIGDRQPVSDGAAMH
jgi:multiple sugar transport system ATP-binding protein